MADFTITPEVERKVAYGQSLYASGKADGAREEREAMVRWLRAMRPNRLCTAGALADDFEAGEHRKP